MQQDTAQLTMREVAFFEGKDYDTIRKRVYRGTIKSIEIDGKKYINPHDMSKKAQTKYYASLKTETAEQLTLDSYLLLPENYKDYTLLNLTDKQRDEAAFWEKAIKDWQSFISDYHKQKTEKTDEFIMIPSYLRGQILQKDN